MVIRYRWVILCLAFLAFVTAYLPRMAYPPLIPEMRVALNLTYTEAGMLMSGFFISYVAMQIPIGFISDKIGVKRVYIIFLSLTGFLCILTGFAVSFTDCLMYRFANGLAAGCIYAPSSALVLRWFPPQNRALAIGFFMVAPSFGNVVAMAFSPVISAIFGSWRWSFWLMGIPAFVAAVLSLFLLKEKPEVSCKENLIGGVGSIGFGMVLRDFRVWFLCFSALGAYSIFNGSLTWIPTYLVKFIGLNEVYAGSISSLITLSGIVGSPFSGFIADKVIKKKSPVVVFGILAASSLCISVSLWMPTELYPAVALFTLIIFSVMIVSVNVSLLADWLPLHVLGTASGFLNFIGMTGAIIGPFIYGFILDLTLSFSLGWLVLGSLAIISALPMISVMLKDLKVKCCET